MHLFFTISVEGSSVFFSISLCTLVLKGELCTSRAAVVLLIVIAVRVLVVVHDLGELVELAFLANGLVTFGIVVVVTILLRLVDTVHHVLLGVGGQGELDLLFGHSVRVHTLHDMRSIRWLHDHLAANLGLEKLKLGVLGEALSTMHNLALNVEHLVANEEGLRAIAPLDNLRIALHLRNVLVKAPDLLVHFLALSLGSRCLFNWLFRGGIRGVAPSEKVADSTPLRIQDALLIFETHIGLHLILFVVEAGGLNTDAVGEVAGEAKIDELGNFGDAAVSHPLLLDGGIELGKGVPGDEATGLDWLLLHHYGLLI